MFAFTHDVYIIGLSLAPDDFLIRSLFLSNLLFIDSFSGIEGRKIFIINPSQDCEKNYSFIISKENVEWRKQNFSMDHVDLMKKRIN